MDFSAVDVVLEEAVRDGTFPGAVVLVRQDGEVVYRKAHGYRSLEPERTPLSEDTVFDLASLTKPLATTVALMRFVAEKKIRLDDRISRFFPNFGTCGKMATTIRHLLSHSSGLPAWRPYYEDLRTQKQKITRLATLGSQSARDFIYAQIQREKAEYEPGTRPLYSDLGFMLLGALIEDMSGTSLDQYCWNKIYRPLGLQAIGFINIETLRQKKYETATEMIAPTERCPWRGRILCGEVHDDNAYAMGGVAGHAGLFAPIDEVDRLVSISGGMPCWRPSLSARRCRARLLDGEHRSAGFDLGLRMGHALTAGIKCWRIFLVPLLWSFGLHRNLGVD